MNKTDPETGYIPTDKQMEIMKILNPFKFDRTYQEAADILSITLSAIKSQMSNLKRRCPVIYSKFKRIRKKHSYKLRTRKLSLDYEFGEKHGKEYEGVTLSEICYFDDDSKYIDFSTKKKDKKDYYKQYKIKRRF